MKIILLFIYSVIFNSFYLFAQSISLPSDSNFVRPGISIDAEISICTDILYSRSSLDSSFHFKDTIKLERPIYQNVKPYRTLGDVFINDDYEVRAQGFNGWQDPGDFNVVSIYRGDSLIFEFSDPWYAFRKIPDSLKTFSSVPNDYFYIFTMENGATAIILRGYCYGSQPPSLTVILLYQGSAHLVYYKEEEFLINNISVSPGGYFELELHDEVPSLDYIPKVYYLKATENDMKIYKTVRNTGS